MFQDKLVMSQLIYSGTLETISVRKSGYPVRMGFEAFVKRYVFIKKNSAIKNDVELNREDISTMCFL